MFEQPIIVILAIVVLASVGIGIGVFSINRRKKVRRLCVEATMAIEQSRFADALQILVTAEQSWTFNAHNGGRKSLMSDLDEFTNILSLFKRLPDAQAAHLPITRVESVVSEVRSLFLERQNFGIDGRCMKREAAVRWAKLSEEFQIARREFRESCGTSKVEFAI